MKSKAPLALMEQMVMLLVFALAAALCLQAFVKSDQISMKSQARSSAALAAQNTAEVLRYSKGTLEHAFEETADRQGGRYLEAADGVAGQLIISYDEDWRPTQEEGAYLLTVQEIPVAEAGLHRVLVQVVDTGAAEKMDDQTVSEKSAQGEPLFELETAWLEGKKHE